MGYATAAVQEPEVPVNLVIQLESSPQHSSVLVAIIPARCVFCLSEHVLKQTSKRLNQRDKYEVVNSIRDGKRTQEGLVE